MIGCTVRTALCRSPIRPSIAPRTKGATWSGNERAPLSQMRIRVYRHGSPLLSEGRQHARGDPGSKAAGPPPLLRGAVVGKRYRRPDAAPAREGGPGPRVESLQSDPGRPLSGHEK